MIRYKRTREQNLEDFVNQANPSPSQIATFAYKGSCIVMGVEYQSDSYDFINNK